jgi:ABC-type uncharacterized transport system permease subunit
MSQMVELSFSFLISQLPNIIIAIVGLTLAHSRLKKMLPRAYLYGNIGFALLLMHSIWIVLGQAYIQASAAQAQDRIAYLNNFTIINLASYIVLTGAIVFIAIAVLADRNTPKSSRGTA